MRGLVLDLTLDISSLPRAPWQAKGKSKSAEKKAMRTTHKELMRYRANLEKQVRLPIVVVISETGEIRSSFLATPLRL